MNSKRNEFCYCLNMTGTLQKKSSAISEDSHGRVLYSIAPVREKIERFPTTRYYGSKRKLLPWLFDSLKLLNFQTVLDGFGGTGSVSMLFRAMRKDVVYHDAFRFNADIATATLTNFDLIEGDKLDQFLSEIAPSEGHVSTVFNGVFFTDAENQWIDGFMKRIGTSAFDKESKAVLMYLLYQACLKKRPFNLFHRSNLSIRTNSTVKRSFGNATTWERSFVHHMSEGYQELKHMRDERLVSAKVLPSGDVSDLPTGYDLVYLDPPYVSSSERANRDNYWLRYHFLEGLSDYDRWLPRIVPSSKVRQMEEPLHFTEWSKRKTFKEKLFSLIEKHRSSIVVLSYVKSAYPDDVEIREFFEATFSHVSVHSTEHSHALSASKKRELLFVGVPS